MTLLSAHGDVGPCFSDGRVCAKVPQFFIGKRVYIGVSGGASTAGRDEEEAKCQAELESCIEALTQAVLVHPLAVAQLMKRYVHLHILTPRSMPQSWLGVHASLSAAHADGAPTVAELFTEDHHEDMHVCGQAAGEGSGQRCGVAEHSAAAAVRQGGR